MEVKEDAAVSRVTQPSPVVLTITQVGLAANEAINCMSGMIKMQVSAEFVILFQMKRRHNCLQEGVVVSS